MSINPELMLIAKILDQGELKKVLDAGLEATHFTDETCAEHFAFLVDYYHDPEHPRSVPTKEIFQERFPRDPLPEVKERPSLEELIAFSRNRQYALACRQVADELSFVTDGGDPLGALENAVASISGVLGRSRGGRDIAMSAFAEHLIDTYQGAKKGLMRGIPWPWDKLNQMTQGIENGNFILIYGRPKMMKSWVANYIGAHFYQHNISGGRVMLMTLEMPPELVARRTAGLLTMVDYEKFTQGKLPRDEEDVAMEYLRELEAVEAADIVQGRKKDFIIAAPDRDMTVLEIESKIEAHQPDLVIIDGIYLLADARTKKSGVDWKILSNVSRDLKQLAQRQKIPIVGVHQANRNKDADADELEDVAFADNFARDADILIKCIKIEHLSHGTMIALLFSGAREFKLAGFYIHGKPAHDFGYIGDFASKEELLSFIRKSKTNHDKSASSPQNTSLVSSAVSNMEGRFGKKNSGAAN
jgi:KaiC/GvpD/RAD55 family RecA-like ATPase